MIYPTLIHHISETISIIYVYLYASKYITLYQPFPPHYIHHLLDTIFSINRPYIHHIVDTISTINLTLNLLYTRQYIPDVPDTMFTTYPTLYQKHTLHNIYQIFLTLYAPYTDIISTTFPTQYSPYTRTYIQYLPKTISFPYMTLYIQHIPNPIYTN
jgi:hypothetical protein